MVDPISTRTTRRDIETLAGEKDIVILNVIGSFRLDHGVPGFRAVLQPEDASRRIVLNLKKARDVSTAALWAVIASLLRETEKNKGKLLVCAEDESLTPSLVQAGLSPSDLFSTVEEALASFGFQKPSPPAGPENTPL